MRECADEGSGCLLAEEGRVGVGRWRFTAPPANITLAGGFRTFNSFQGFGHGDVGFFKDLLDFGRFF